MEQRWSPRTRVKLDVDLFFKGEEISGCKTRDIGMGGAFIEISDEVKLKKAVIELVFKLGSGDQCTKQRIKANVVRISDDGIGLMFRDFDSSAFRSLQEVLQYAQSHTVH